MHLREIQLRSFKRFTNLTITDLPPTARLVVLAGPNGSGKSSLFDAFRHWYGRESASGTISDSTYSAKKGEPSVNWDAMMRLTFHEAVPPERQDRKKLFYIRSAYRNESDFRIEQLQRVGTVFDAPKVSRLIDNDSTVSDNYRRLVSASIEGVYSGRFDSTTVRELRESYIGELRASMARVFESLILRGPGDPLRDGSFYFEKGASLDFHYKNLSGGEKAAFDLLLDLCLKRAAYDDTIYCIDEPETHMHTRLQSRLLGEIFSLVPSTSQLWIATHSIGMMRRAVELNEQNPGQVVFLDFHDKNFDETVVLRPVSVNRAFWSRLLDVAMDDLAQLVAPRRVVLCEGRPSSGANDAKAEFDARCYRAIFGEEFPDTDFVSVGNASDVQADRLQIGRAIQTLISGTTVIRVVDRDDQGENEIDDLQRAGVRVLSRRHLESYLLDDQILENYCVSLGRADRVSDVLAAKRQAILDSVARGNPTDDVKSAAGQLYNELRRLLLLVKTGDNAHAFMRDTLTKHVLPGTAAYDELRKDIFA